MCSGRQDSWAQRQDPVLIMQTWERPGKLGSQSATLGSDLLCGISGIGVGAGIFTYVWEETDRGVKTWIFLKCFLIKLMPLSLSLSLSSVWEVFVLQAGDLVKELGCPQYGACMLLKGGWGQRNKPRDQIHLLSRYVAQY